MDDDAPKENPPADFNKLDLSQLQGFSFGTQWTQDKTSPADRRDRDSGGDRSRRDERREGGAPERRDRRSFRRPAPTEAGPGAGGPSERRDFDGPRGPRREEGGYRGGPRRDAGRSGDFRGYGGRREPIERGPYESPYYAVTFYPEDTSFNTLVQTIRKSCRTIELFEIARTVVAKPERFVVVLAHKSNTSAPADSASRAPASPDVPEPTAKQPKTVFHIAVPDGMPFETDDGAVAHVLAKHLDKFFETAEVEVEAPKGNFQVINRCGVTGELLGPPNYHRYNQIVQQHYAAKVAARMPFEVFRSRIETVREPEVVNQWLAKMKKTTRYTWKQAGKPAAPVPESPATDAAAPVSESLPAPVAPSFDTLEDARIYLLTHARDKVVRIAETARFHGKTAEQLPPGEIRRAVEGALDRQRRFPLDTANALRGRLRREHFTIFKKGSKGVSYVCAVKRKFRVPGQTFSDSIGALISYIEANPMVRVSELSAKFLGIVAPRAPEPAVEPVPAADAAGAAPAPEPARPETTLTLEERAKISRMQGDLMWLVREGYVTEFIDGRLFAPPPMVEARKREVEDSEHDPENFPEAPAVAEATPPAAPESPAGSTPAETTADVAAPEASPDATAAPAPEETPRSAAEPPQSAPAAS
ncbi:MAG TPA: hypothetical protein VHE61_04970 [Opitutaceae bacterium]|nr:hypothetical protein [Opitutaceae bacterium]